MKFVQLTKSKADNIEAIVNFIIKLEKQTGNTVKILRTDNATEYNSQKLKDFANTKGIKLEKSAPYKQSQNGLAERAIGTITDTAITLLQQAGLPHYYWGYAVLYAAELLNRSPTTALNGITPYQKWNGRPPSITNIHPFGCAAIAKTHIKRRKF